MSAQANGRAAATLLGVLAQGGVQAVVFSPGSRSTPLVLAALAHPDLEAVPVLDERAAGFLALGMARASRRPVVLICTSGSAGAHWLPAVIEARQDHLPLILLTADRPPELVGSGAGQTIDQRRFFGAFVVAEAQLPSPEPGLATGVFAAFAEDALAAVVRGPVHLNVPFREPLWSPEVDYTPPAARPGFFGPAKISTEIHGLEALATALAAARRGVIYCGPGDDDPWGEAADALARALDWPLLVEASSGARFGPGDAEGRITSYEALLRVPVFAAAHRPDCVLHFGAAAHARAVDGWLGQVPVLLVDPHGDRHDPAHRAVGRWQADPRAVCAALAQRSWPAAEVGWRARWWAAEVRAGAALTAACATGLWEGALAAEVAAAAPSALHVASSMPFRDVDAFARASARSLKVFCSRGASGIDGTVATALGEARVAGPMVALLGDLALTHDASGLLLAGELAESVNLTLVVPDNGGGGIFEFLPIAGHRAVFERAFLTPQRVDFRALAAAAGVRYVRIEARAELGPALAAAIAQPGVDLIHVIIDRAANVVRHQQAWAAVATALEAP